MTELCQSFAPYFDGAFPGLDGTLQDLTLLDSTLMDLTGLDRTLMDLTGLDRTRQNFGGLANKKAGPAVSTELGLDKIRVHGTLPELCPVL